MNPMFEPNPTIYPTLVIGLGGSGANVVRYVKPAVLEDVESDDYSASRICLVHSRCLQWTRSRS